MNQFYWPSRLFFMVGLLLSVAACNSTDATLGVTPEEVAKGAASTVTPTTSAEASKASARLYIAPIIGSTVAAVTPLSRRLTALAPANGLALVANTDPTKTYVMKGYFSALPENGATVIVFVWDVFDPAGVRQHRIQGQTSVAGTAADPWSIVAPTVMENIAERTITDFKAWQGNISTPLAVPAPVAPPIAPPVAAPVAQPVATPEITPSTTFAPAVAPIKPAPIPTVPAPPPSFTVKP